MNTQLIYYIPNYIILSLITIYNNAIIIKVDIINRSAPLIMNIVILPNQHM